MLILEIAAGIVLAVLVILLWPYVLGLIVICAGLGIVGFLIALACSFTGGIWELLGTLAGMCVSVAVICGLKLMFERWTA